MIGIVASDMAASLPFYRLLGLEIPEDASGHVEVKTPNGYRIAWDTEALMKDLYPDWETPRGQRTTLAFKCDSPAEVDALYGRIVQSGYQGYKEPWDAFWGQRYAVVRDPDGNLVDLFASL
jgi:uncharacterized glyoxalase superfamily protein PhnB